MYIGIPYWDCLLVFPIGIPLCYSLLVFPILFPDGIPRRINIGAFANTNIIFSNDILPPYALVVTSDFSNAALLRAGASGLQKHLVRATELVQIRAQTQRQIWVRLTASSWLPPRGCLLNDDSSMMHPP